MTRLLGALGLAALASCARTTPAPVPLVTWGFTAPWDARSDSSVRAHAAQLDAIVTGWIQLDSVTGQPARLYADDATRVAATARYAFVTTWHGQRFHPETVRLLAADPGALALAASRVGTIVHDNGYRGIVLDFENQSTADLPLTVRVAGALADSARRQGAAVVAIALPAADTAAYPAHAFIPLADFVVVMLYDEHWATSAPGPITTPEWARRMLGQRVADVGASHVVAALPLYGYLWRPNQPAEVISFDDAKHAAAQANVDLSRDPASQSLHAIQPGSWELWMSDAEQWRALLSEVTALGVTHIAAWRLGLEDPAIWSVMSRAP